MHTKIILFLVFFLGSLIAFAERSKSVQSDESDDGKRRVVDTSSYRIVNGKAEPPILQYRGPRGHHGQRITDNSVESVMIWADGTIAWEVLSDTDQRFRYPDGYYVSTIPVEKVEKAVKAIVASSKKHPVENRPSHTGAFYRLGAHYSAGIDVWTPELYAHSWMDYDLLSFYKKKRDLFLSDDMKAKIQALKDLNIVGMPRLGLVNYYRATYPHIGLRKERDENYSDEEIKKCAELFTAECEHLILMDEQILALVPSHKGLKPKKRDYKTQYVKVERETVDGKRRYVYSLISEKEYDALNEDL